MILDPIEIDFFIIFCVVDIVTIGFIQAASVMPSLISTELLLGTVAYWFDPFNCNAFPNTPGTNIGFPIVLAIFILVVASLSTVPLDSSMFQQATNEVPGGLVVKLHTGDQLPMPILFVELRRQ